MRRHVALSSSLALAPLPARCGALALLVTLGLAGCGGGGGGGGPIEPPLNEGAYDAADFAYVDPNPPEFHPLSNARYTVTQQDEVLGFRVAVGAAWEGFEWDDGAHSGAPIGDAAGPLQALLAGSGFELLDAVAGNVDGQPGDELVLVGHSVGFGFQVFVFSQLTLGTYSFVGSHDVWSKLASTYLARVRLADMNQDGLQDIVVSCEARIGGSADGKGSVFHSHNFGGVYSLEERFSVTSNDAAAIEQTYHFVPGNFEGSDDELELVLTRHLFSGGTDYAVYDYEPVSGGYFQRRAPTDLHPGQNGLDQPVRVQFDQDEPDEIAWCGDRNRVYGMNASYQLVLAAEYPGFTNNVAWPSTGRVDAVVAADFDGDQVEEIAVSAFRAVDRVWGVVFSNAARDPWGVSGDQWVAVTSMPVVDFATVDSDADGKDELWVVESAFAYGTRGFLAQPSHALAQLEVEAGETFYPVSASYGQPLAVAGDFDAEGLTLEYTGVKTLQLANPIPLVLMAAPPTKSGISQAQDGASTSYGNSTGTQTSSAVKTGLTLSYGLGISTEIPNVMKAGVKAKCEIEFERSVEHTLSVTHTTVYSGGYDTDVIVFQGTLYRNYEYRIVAAHDPMMIGELVTIDNPVDARIYKWSLPFYQSIATSGTDLSTLLLHTIGDPSTYRTPAAASALLATRESWPEPSQPTDLTAHGSTVGQGTGETSLEIELNESTATETERQVTVGGEYEVGAGPFTYSNGFDWKWGWSASVETSTGSTYGATVPDIELPADYTNWGYRWGVYVYHHGVDPAGNQIPGLFPCTVLDYWTDSLGPGY